MVERIIKVVIASPSDVIRERKSLLDKLQTYFTRYKYEDLCNARIIVEGWENVPSQSGYTQDIINSTLIKNADIVLALFRHKLGNPTINTKTGKDRSPSGTAEELRYAINQNKKNRKPLAMLFYYENPPRLNFFAFKAKDEWKNLQAFKEEIRTEIRHKLYDDNEEKLLRTVCDDICDNIRNHKLLVEEKK
jgi:hypothetical protein